MTAMKRFVVLLLITTCLYLFDECMGNSHDDISMNSENTDVISSSTNDDDEIRGVGDDHNNNHVNRMIINENSNKDDKREESDNQKKIHKNEMTRSDDHLNVEQRDNVGNHDFIPEDNDGHTNNFNDDNSNNGNNDNNDNDDNDNNDNNDDNVHIREEKYSVNVSTVNTQQQQQDGYNGEDQDVEGTTSISNSNSDEAVGIMHGPHMKLQYNYHMSASYYDSNNPNKFYIQTPHNYGGNVYYYTDVFFPPGHNGISRYAEYILTFDSSSRVADDTFYIKNGNGGSLYSFVNENIRDRYPNGLTVTSYNGIQFTMSTNYDWGWMNIGNEWGFLVYVTMKNPLLWENTLSSYPSAQRVEIYSSHDYWNNVQYYSNSFYHNRGGLTTEQLSQYTITFDPQTAIGAYDYLQIKEGSGSTLLYSFYGLYSTSSGLSYPPPSTSHYTSVPPSISFNADNGIKIYLNTDSSNTKDWGFKLTVEMAANPAVWLDRKYGSNTDLRNCPANSYNETVDAYRCYCTELYAIHDTDLNECIPSILFTGLGISSSYMPFAFYQAEDYDEQTHTWPEAFGRNRNVEITGTSITKKSVFNNHGAKGNVTYISGGVLDKMNFPKGTSSVFTYCTVSKYVGNMNRKRVFTAGDESCSYKSYFYHGHDGGLRGVARYGVTHNTAYANVDDDVPEDDWLVMCGTNSGSYSTPYSIVADGKRISTYTYGQYCNLGVNTNSDTSYNSDWAVAAVVIFDSFHTELGYSTSKGGYLSTLESRLRNIYLNNACTGDNQFHSAKLILSKGRTTNTNVDIGQMRVDKIFQVPGAVLRRDCRDCDVTHRTIYYKRLTEIPVGFSIYENIKNTWRSTYNIINIDFKLYSTWNDLIYDHNPWSYCEYDSTDRGFPYNCAPSNLTIPISSQFNSEVYSGQDYYDYYILQQPVNGTDEIEGCSSCPYDASINTVQRRHSFVATSCVCDNPAYILTYNSTLRQHVCAPYDVTMNISGSQPFAIWRADDYNADMGVIKEASGRILRDTHMLSPTNIQIDGIGDYGVGGNSDGVFSVIGNYYTQMITAKATAAYWTVCSLTRTGYSSPGYVLTQPTTYGTWYHGHSSSGSRGYYYYNTYAYNTIFIGYNGRWLVQCAQNSDNDAPKNILSDGLPLGGRKKFSASSSPVDIQFGMGWSSSRSYEVGLSELIVWDRWITIEEMESVSNVLLSRLCGTQSYWDLQLHGCNVCPIDSISSGSTCLCPANTYWDVDNSNTCISCPGNSTSLEGSLVCTCGNTTQIISNGVCLPYFTDVIKNENSKEPWGIYRAEKFNEGVLRIVEARGRRERDAIAYSIPDGTTSISMKLFQSLATGNGVLDIKPIYELSNYGQLYSHLSSYYSQNSGIVFPKMPGDEFTYCSITRQVSYSSYNVLSSVEEGCTAYHGHYNYYRGPVNYGNTWFNQYQYGSSWGDWVVVCGRNLPSTNYLTYSNNVILDTVPIGNPVYSATQQCQMGLNYQPQGQSSQYYWAFSELIMWDHHLSDEDMLSVNEAMYQRLVYQRQFNVTAQENGDYSHSPRVSQEYICDRAFDQSSMSFGRCYLKEENPASPEIS